MVRGYETPGHVYVKRLLINILHEEGCIVAEEAIFPNRATIDVLAVRDGKTYFFEVTRIEGSHSEKRKRVLDSMKWGIGKIIHYDENKLPTKDKLKEKVLEVLV